MLTAEGCAETEPASRYLVQLCEHVDQIGHHHVHRAPAHDAAPPDVRHVNATQTRVECERGRRLRAGGVTAAMHAPNVLPTSTSRLS